MTDQIDLDQFPPAPLKSDAIAMMAFVQGATCWATYTFARDHLRQPTQVQQPTDDDGTILPYFLLHMASGLVIRVQFSVEDVP